MTWVTESQPLSAALRVEEWWLLLLRPVGLCWPPCALPAPVGSTGTPMPGSWRTDRARRVGVTTVSFQASSNCTDCKSAPVNNKESWRTLHPFTLVLTHGPAYLHRVLTAILFFWVPHDTDCSLMRLNVLTPSPQLLEQHFNSVLWMSVVLFMLY